MIQKILSTALLLAVVLATVAVQAEEAAVSDTTICRSARILGPLPTCPTTDDTGIPRGSREIVPEIAPERVLPPAAKDGWHEMAADARGRFRMREPGIYWVAARLRTARFGKVNLVLDHGSALFSEGEELGKQDPGATAEPLSAETTLTRGWVTVMARVILGEDEPSFGLRVAADSTVQAVWSLVPAVAVTRFADTDQVASLSSLAVAEGGKLVARFLSRRSDGTGRLDILDGRGKVVAADIGGGQDRPVGFLPGGKRLLLRQGKNLILWDVPGGQVRVVLKDEPGLGFVRIGAEGRFLLFASEKGFETDDPVDGPGRRYTRFRERISDYTPAAHLHLLDLRTGVRRLLTRSGDFVLDDAVFGAHGKSVIYGRTLPRAERPWFTSEIRRIDLATGEDRLLAGFTSGWEVRPQAFAASPDGRQLAFIGPPAEIGADRTAAPQHNVYNKQVWLLDLADGGYRRITRDESFAFEGGGGFPVFKDKDHLLVRVIDGSANRLATLTRGRDRWRAEALPQQGTSLGAVVISPRGKYTAYTVSDPDRPSSLYLAAVGKAGRLLEDPNTLLDERTLWAPARDMAFTGPGEERIDAWFYPPLEMTADGGGVFSEPDAEPAPLIVYYYGGSAATMRSFNTTFQFFAANGYGVLVVNPRGAAGYGEAFADHHAGDWGPDAAADIMAATEYVLASVPYLDREAMGIYGGSYGGFMTDYLVTHTDMYAAAVSMYGISDLMTYFGQGAWGVTYGDMALGGRNPWDDPGYFTEHSPVFQADKVTTPLLLLHGLADTNVTTGESIQLFTELSVLDKPVEMVLFPDEDHGISGTWENRTAHRTMMLEWFDRWLKDQPEAWEDRWQ